MSQISSTYGGTLTAFFDSREDAEDAVERLVDAGIPQASVRLVTGNEGSAPAPEAHHKGFFESLADFFMPDEDRYSYAEGLRRGGYLVTVTGLSDDLRQGAIDILDDEGAVDFEARESEWRTEGWQGYAGSAAVDSGVTGTDQDFAASSRSTIGRDEEVIPVVEEELRVGKRDVNLGRVRVRSYVVEQPVSEQVSLSNERVVVERHPVDRAVGAGDVAFEDRSIEAEEHAEEAVVAKTARVTEEITLRKERDQRTEQVSDTVRRTEVEVEDERGLNRRDTGTKPIR